MAPEAKSVSIAGEFNNWDPQKTPLEKVTDKVWTCDLKLNKGKYEYKLVIDGAWS